MQPARTFIIFMQIILPNIHKIVYQKDSKCILFPLLICICAVPYLAYSFLRSTQIPSIEYTIPTYKYKIQYTSQA